MKALAVLLAFSAFAHVQTWIEAGFDGYNHDWTPEQLAATATIAEFSEYDLDRIAAFKANGGHFAIVYTDPSLVPYCAPPFSIPAGVCRGPFGDQHLPEDAWFHQENGERARRPDSYTGEYQEFLDPGSAAVRAAVRARTEGMLRRAPIDLFFADDSGSSLRGGDDTPESGIFYGFEQPGIEIPSDDAWIAAESGMLASFARPVIFNGGDIDTWLPAYGGAFLRSLNVVGASREGCFSNDASGLMNSQWRHWQMTANDLLATTALDRYAVCMETGTPSTTARLYDYASWLLTWNVFSVVAPLWEQADRQNVFPEIEIVPSYPMETAYGDIDTLRDNGVYRRDFGACRIGGQDVGACAAIVNPGPDAADVSALTGRYHYAVQLDGRTIDQGGEIQWGRWDSNALSPESAEIVFARPPRAAR